jgi:hypothetical protein
MALNRSKWNLWFEGKVFSLHFQASQFRIEAGGDRRLLLVVLLRASRKRGFFVRFVRFVRDKPL